MKKLFEDDPRFKFYEMTVCFMSVAILILLCIVLYFMFEKPQINNCDVNRDGTVNALDLLIVQKEILEHEPSDA